MKFKSVIIWLIIIFISQISNLYSQNGEKYVKLTAKPTKLDVKSGDKFSIHVSIQLKDPWYTYSLKEQVNKEGIGPSATAITVQPDNLFVLSGNIKAPKGHIKNDKAYDMNIEYYKVSVDFEIPVKAKKKLDFSKDKCFVIVSMQLCNTTSCLPQDDYKVRVMNEVYAEANNKEKDNPETVAKIETMVNPKQDSGQKIEQAKQTDISTKEIKSEEKPKTSNKTGFLSMILIAMAAGAASLLTPCVFPMVPITVSFFTKRVEHQKGKSKGLRDALVYAIGIIVTFTGLGLLFSIFFGATGIQNFTSSPWVALFISLIFVIFGLSLFGAFEIQLPTGLLNKLNAKSAQGNGIASVILMGLTFSLASFSCTGPLVGAALITASSGEWFYPMISMVGFSTVLAAPFFLLALFPTALTSLPRAGSWMNNIKGVLGFLTFAASMKFINGAISDWGFGLSRDLFLGFWVGLSLLVTLYILGVFKLQHDAPVDRVGTTRLLFAMLFATLTFYLISGFSGRTMGALEAYLPAPDETVSALSSNNQSNQFSVQQLTWIEDYKTAVELAKKENKPIFIDFSGKHCPNCRLMERTVFGNPEINKLFSKMILVRLITDVREEPYLTNKQMQLNKYNSVELPLYIILKPNEEFVAQRPFTPNENDFKQFLEKGFK